MSIAQKNYSVVVIEKRHGTPLTLAYATREEAMRSANGLRATLPPREGGRVVVKDPEGKELQSWVEEPAGAHFTHQGGFLH
jgi:hypothetical protein